MVFFNSIIFSMTDENSKLIEILSSNIKTMRKASRISQEQLSELTGISVRHISQIECAVSYPSGEKVESIAKALGVPAYRLFLPEEISFDINLEYVSKSVLHKELNKAINQVLGDLD